MRPASSPGIAPGNTMKHHDTHLAETRRRWLAAGAALPALASLGALHAQVKPPVVIGWLSTGSPDSDRPELSAFNEGMATPGWRLGAQYLVEARLADGRVDRLPALAQELAAKKPAVIVARPSTSARAAAEAAPTTPIVVVSGNPFSTGLVQSLSRPGGMVTGLSVVSNDLNQKVFELLVEALPKLRRVGFLADSTSSALGAQVAYTHRAAERLGVQAVIVDMARPEDIEPAVVRLAKDKVQALVILANSWFLPHLPKIVQLALAQRWPVVGVRNTIPRQGGLFSYTANAAALDRRVAHYVDRILKGAKPGDLPIEQPTTFELILNMKTAKTLGITFPPSMRLRATEVIE